MDGHHETEDRVLPLHRLPAGFLGSLGSPPSPPVVPHPSATLVLLREGAQGLEVLLLKRNPRSRFIPGAWVFPGGRVDDTDEDPRVFQRVQGLSPEDLERRLGSETSQPPAFAYWIAAIRETFEETGILLGRIPEAGPKAAEAMIRKELLSGKISFLDALEALDAVLDGEALEYNGHWLTPECEPRRYDTRFFAAESVNNASVRPHQEELVDALWLTPAQALKKNMEGTLPLVLPTLFTLEELQPFHTPRDALGYLRKQAVPRRLPVPEREKGGIRFRLTP